MKAERILIVDDELPIREMMQEILEREGYQAIAVGSGDEALSMAEGQDFDLLIADIKMPQMDGLELVQKFRELSPETIPMLITGHASVETAQMAVREGVYDYIVKPFERSDLCAAVAQALRRKRITDEENRLKELTGLYEVSQSIVTSPEQREVLDLILSAALHQTKSSGGAILLFDTSKQGLMVAAAWGTWEPATRVANLVLEQGIDKWIAEMSGPLLFTDLQQHPLFDQVRQFSPEQPLLAPSSKGVEMLLLPVRSERETFGVLSVYREGETDLLGLSDLELLTILATQAGLSVKCRQTFSELENGCIAALRSVASYVEGRIYYFKDHLERVTQLSEQLGWRIGLDEREINTMKLGTSLHDIGLIGVSEAILGIPGELTSKEWEVVKLHPIIGDDILAPLPFLSEARHIVRHHHERLDGKGYPDGLSGDEITPPLRVVSLCDSYDAMTSPRPWRQALAKEEAIAMLIEEKGTKFDPQITSAFMDMLKESID